MRAMDLVVRDDLTVGRAHVHRRGGVGQQRDLEAPVRGLPGGGVAAHLGHEAGDDHPLDAQPPQVALQRRVGEGARQMLGDDRLTGRRGVEEWLYRQRIVVEGKVAIEVVPLAN